jgi:hypothetical protein
MRLQKFQRQTYLFPASLALIKGATGSLLDAWVVCFTVTRDKSNDSFCFVIAVQPARLAHTLELRTNLGWRVLRQSNKYISNTQL